MKSGIYKIEHIDSGKVYVGSAANFVKRFSAHRVALRKSSHPNSKLQRAWDKYGESSFNFVIIEAIDDQKILIIREQFWINKLVAVANGYNIAPTAGSALGRKTSPETKAKLSAALKGRKAHPNLVAALTGRFYSPETRAKLSAAKLGKLGRKHTPEQRVARSIWQTGKKHSKETRMKMSVAQKGKTFSPEALAKMSASHLGKKPTVEARRNQSAAMIGRVVSPETREKISLALRERNTHHLRADT